MRPGREVLPWPAQSPEMPLLFFYGCTCGTWKFLGQGLNLRYSCDLHGSCGNTRSFTPLRQAEDLTSASSVT